MTDILSVVSMPTTKWEIMARANLSFDQCQKYLPALRRLGLVSEFYDARSHRFAITEKGREYYANMAGAYGRIDAGDVSIWSTRRHLQNPLI